MERGESPFSEGGSLRICLIYPNSYAVGAVNLGFATLFRMLNECDEITAERAFALQGPSLSGKRVTQLSEPRSIETLRSLNEFAIIAFSFMSEFDYLNGVEMLKAAGIPWQKSERAELAGNGHQLPLILVGGAAPTLNPLPLVELADIIIQGEWEDSGPVISKLMVEGWDEDGKAGVVESLAGFANSSIDSSCDSCSGSVAVSSGAYDGRENASFVEGTLLLSTKHAAKPMAWLDLISDETVFANMGLVEGTRGCPFTCRFCSARRLYHPFRIVPVASILEYVERIKPHCNRIGLVGAGISAHPQLCEILRKIRGLELGTSLSSMRLDMVNEELLELLSDSGQKTVTVAPESFSSVTLASLSKKAPKEGFAHSLSKILACSFPVVKAYMMMGIPDDDFENSVLEGAKVMKELGKAARSIELSYSVFQPKPGTHMADTSMAPSKTLKREARLIRKVLGPLVRSVNIPSLKVSATGDLLSRGGTNAISLSLTRPFPKKLAALSIASAKEYWMKPA